MSDSITPLETAAAVVARAQEVLNGGHLRISVCWYASTIETPHGGTPAEYYTTTPAIGPINQSIYPGSLAAAFENAGFQVEVQYDREEYISSIKVTPHGMNPDWI